MTPDEFETLLGWPARSAGARLNALGLCVTCSRCGGSGHYSFNQIDGTRCFKCRGARKTLPARLTKKLAKEAAERVAAGGLVEYFARIERTRNAKAALTPLCAQAKAIYDTVGAAYSAAYRDFRNSPGCEHPLFALQTRNNAAYYGEYGGGAHFGPILPGVTRVLDMAKRGELDPELAVHVVRIQIERLRAIRAEWESVPAGFAPYPRLP